VLGSAGRGVYNIKQRSRKDCFLHRHTPRPRFLVFVDEKDTSQWGWLGEREGM